MASKLLMIIVFVFDLIAFALAIAAEQRRSTATIQTDNEQVYSYCVYDSDISTGFGVGAFLFLMAGQILIMVASRCFCFGKPLSPGGSRGCAVLLFVKGLVDTSLAIIPNQCIQPKEQRLDKSQIDNQESIPTIDLTNFDDLSIEKSIQEAASKWGFFQIINHGIPIEVLEDLKDAAHNFFELPAEEKVKYHKEKVSVGDSALLFWSAIGEKNEKVLEWRDSLRHGCNPQNDSNHWPPQTRNQVLEYQKWAKPLAKKLLEVLLKGLNVNEIDESLEPLLMGTMSINVNYYPPCPNPSVAIGFRRHCDMDCITLLLQDDTGGLYVRGTKGDNWIHVNPIKGALAVNIGDSLQIMSNDRYKSIEHCVAVDSSRARISVPLFVNPSFDSVIGPFPQMLKDGEKPVYKHILFSDYWDHCFIKRPFGKASLDFAKI